MALVCLDQTDLWTVDGNGVITIDPSIDYVSVAWDGLTIPFDSMFMHENGQVDGATSTTVLADSTASFPASGYATGFTARNTSKATAAVSETMAITSNDTVSATGSGALSNSATWESGNYYEIIVAGLGTGDKIWYKQTSDQGGAVSISVKGVVSITGASGAHTFLYYLEDVDDGGSLSPLYTYTGMVA